ncbi:MAG: endonuclease/exonuclease/phosphatase family protein, partial [Alphaproteobacteria bacterium]
MKIVTYNIQFGLGKDGRFDLERIASEVNGADIIALQEVERYWQRSGNVDQPELLGHFLPDYYWAYGPYFDVDASTHLPGGGIKNVRRQFGNMILSKTPILSTRLFPLPKSDLRHSHNMVVGVFEGVVELQQDGALRIYNAHLGARSRSDRVAQIDSIRDTIRRAPVEGGAWTSHHVNSLWKEDAAPPPMPESFILLGDFNLEAKDPEYDHLAGPRDGHLGRRSSGQEFIDTWTLTGHNEGEGSTYSADPASSDAQSMRIDYAFI